MIQSIKSAIKEQPKEFVLAVITLVAVFTFFYLVSIFAPTNSFIN